MAKNMLNNISFQLGGISAAALFGALLFMRLIFICFIFIIIILVFYIYPQFIYPNITISRYQMLGIYIVGYLLIVIFGSMSKYVNYHKETTSNIIKYFAYVLLWPLIIFMIIAGTLGFLLALIIEWILYFLPPAPRQWINNRIDRIFNYLNKIKIY